MHDDCPVEARTLDSLRLAERFVVWALREWRLRRGNGETRPETLRRGFHHADIGDGLTPFCDFMEALVSGTRRPLDVRCMNCPYVSPDEDLVLDAVAAAQRDREEIAKALLMDALPPAAARIAAGLSQPSRTKWPRAAWSCRVDRRWRPTTSRSAARPIRASR